MKRIVSWLLTVVLFLTLTMPVAMASDEKKSGNFTYRIKGNGTAVITGYDWSSMNGQDIYIPRMLDGYIVTEIGKEAFTRLQYDENGVIAASFHAKAGSLVLPDTIVSIGEKAFMNIMFNTKSIMIPASIEYIGAGAFSNCACEQFVVDPGNPIYATINGAIYNKNKKELVAFPAAFTVSGSPGNYTINIPEGIVGIGDFAMFGLGNIGYSWMGLNYKLPNTLKYIGDYAFAHNEGFGVTLKKEGYKKPLPFIHLPDSVLSIGEGAFYKAASYGNFDYPQQIILDNTQITEIPALCFYDVETSTPICFPDSLISIGEKAFKYSDIGGTWEDEYVVFPASLKHIGKEAFMYCNLNVSFAFPSNATLVSIGDSAFEACEFSSLYFNGKLILPEGIESIGEKAFYNVDDLEWVVLPESVEVIGDNLCERSSVSLDVVSGSFAAMWASENGYNTYQAGTEDTSWLN